MQLLEWICLIIFLLAFVLYISAYIVYRLIFFVKTEKTKDVYNFPKGEQYDAIKETMVAMADDVLSIPFEDVYIRSHDNLKLHGRIYQQSDTAPVHILFHGFRSNAFRDFSGGLRLSLDCGSNAILVDQRAHGDSEGHTLTLGILERQDCLRWIQFARERFGENVPIILIGISMGAATVLSASELDLPSNVKGIIGDCGYSSPREIVRCVMRQMHYPVTLLYPLVVLSAGLFAHVSFNDFSVTEALRFCKIPVLFIHGEDDRFVPCSMGRKNYEACAGRKTLFTVPRAGHGLSYVLDKEGYCSHVRQFLSEVLESEEITHHAQ